MMLTPRITRTPRQNDGKRSPELIRTLLDLVRMGLLEIDADGRFSPTAAAREELGQQQPQEGAA